MSNAFKGKGFHYSGNGRKGKDSGSFICRVGNAHCILIYWYRFDCNIHV